ncbi:MAG: hypothetical protein FVQ80_17260 [Planctomycetes bacterium]|nr:hypothetical protein [Planctomycetota bacterium]
MSHIRKSGIIESMGIKQRSELRKKRIVAHRARNFEEAEQWDLLFWQNRSPADRLSALVAIRRDIEKIKTVQRKS